MHLPDEIRQKLSISETAVICHVDDDVVHTSIVSRYHQRAKMKNPYMPFDDGDSFLDYLTNMKRNGDELPLLVLLDINMPGKDGFEVLQEFRAIDEFQCIPVCSMLSSSTYQGDIQKSKDLGANSYLVKPDKAKEYVNFFKEIMRVQAQHREHPNAHAMNEASARASAPQR